MLAWTAMFSRIESGDTFACVTALIWIMLSAVFYELNKARTK
jgi:hypothetical protein